MTTASVDVIARTAAYESAFKRLTSLTDREAAKAALALEKRLTKAQERAARAAEKATRDTARAAERAAEKRARAAEKAAESERRAYQRAWDMYERNVEAASRKAALAQERAAARSRDAWQQVGNSFGLGLAFGGGIGAVLAWARGLELAFSAAAATARGLFHEMKGVVDHRVEMANLAAETGLAAETLDAMYVAARRGNVDFEQIVDSARDFAEVAFDFEVNGGRAEETLVALGVQVRKRNGEFRNANDLFVETITKLQGVEDRTLQLALAQQIGSDHTAKLLRALDGTRLDEYAEAARRLHLAQVDGGKSAAAYRDRVGEIHLAWEGLMNAFLGSDLSPLEGIATKIRNALLTAIVLVEMVDTSLASMKPPEWLLALPRVLADSAGGMLGGAAGRAAVAAAAGTGRAVGRGTAPRVAELERMLEMLAMTQRQMDGVGGGAAMDRIGAARGTSSGGRARGASGQTPVFDISDYERRVQQAAETLATTLDELRERNQSTFEAINAKWDEFELGILDAAIVLEDFDTADAILAEARKARMEELADASRRLTKQVVGDLDTQKLAQRDLMREQVGIAARTVSTIADASEAILELYVAQGEGYARHAKRWAGISKALAVFDVAMKSAQAIATSIAKIVSNPVEGALGLIASITGLLSGVVQAVSQPVPTFHSGGTVTRAARADDEVMAKLRVDEVVVDGPTARSAGGAAGVNDRLRGGGNTYLLDLGDQVVPLLARKVSRHVVLPTAEPVGM